MLLFRHQKLTHKIKFPMNGNDGVSDLTSPISNREDGRVKVSQSFLPHIAGVKPGNREDN